MPSLDFLRQVIAPDIGAVTAEIVKVSASPSVIYRLRLARTGANDGFSLIAKRIAPDWPDDPGGHERECRFYQCLRPHLDLPWPHVYYAGSEPDSDHHVVIMADVAGQYRFPPPAYVWTQAEIRCILRAYACLHSQGERCLPPPAERGWLMARHEERLRARAHELPSMVATLVERGIWRPLPTFPRLLEQTLINAARVGSEPLTLLHNDVYPPNLGLPADLAQGNALLVDWEMLGWGLAEMDLAFMFLQPFRSHRNLDRAAVLDYYWAQRQKLEGKQPAAVVRQSIQRYADTLWALWLIPVAHRMALSPYPPGSAPRIYWDSMFGVLEERLQQL